ncbi:MAG: hypothetical protein Q4A00_00060 [Flavobacteriaceae bacterium]|nr:hypothetical protein [Flavobacteriaceae bacterium]
MAKSKILLFLAFCFFILLQVLFSFGLAPLSDDLTHYLDVTRLRNGDISVYDVYKDLFNDPNRYTRPFSPILLGTFIVLSQFSENMFFLWGILGAASCYLVYRTTLKLFNNRSLAILAFLLVMLFPLSSSNLFSPVMQTGHYIIFSFTITTLLIQSPLFQKKTTCIFLLILNTTTHLFYEMNLFLTPLLLLLIWKNTEKKYFNALIVVVLPIVIAFSYKLFFAKLIYPNYFDYSSSKITLGFDRIKEVWIALIKLFTTDTLYIVIKSFEMISLYSIWDFILMFLGIGIALLTAIFIKPNNLVSKTHIGVLISFFLMTIFIFFISNYPPIAFSFENRILLWVRISSSLLLAVFINNALFWYQSYKLLNAGLRLGIFTIIFSGAICLISQKNSWIFASEYNKNLVRNLEKAFPINQEQIKVLYVLDKEKKDRLITDEAVLSADYEISAAIKLYTNANFNPRNIAIFNPINYSLYQIGNIKLNKRPKTKFKLDKKGIKLRKNILEYPFYIFDERDNSVSKIENQNQFKIK